MNEDQGTATGSIHPDTAASVGPTDGPTAVALPDEAAVIEQATEMARRLDDPELDPEPGRTFSGASRARIDELVGLLERLVGPFEAAAPTDSADEAVLRARLAWMIGEVFSVLHASGDARGAAWLARASALSPDESGRELFAAAAREPAIFTQVVRTHWLRRADRWSQAESLARRLIRATREPRLIESARRSLETPRPIDGAPSLFTLNGCGVALYGHRDDRPDGSYVATYFVTLLFLPLLPIRAYRVASDGGEGYYFIGKVPLGPLARAWRALLALLLVGGIATSSIGAYLGSPDRLASKAISELAAREPGTPAAAVEEYERLVRAHATASPASLRPAATAMVRHLTRPIPSPFTPAHLHRAEAVVARLQTLPRPVVEGAPAAMLSAQLERWSGELSGSTLEALEARLTLAGLGVRVAASSGRATWERRQLELQATLGQKLAADWPVEAFGHLSAAAGSSPAARAAAVALLGRLQAQPALLAELRVELDRLKQEGPEGLAAAARAASEKLAPFVRGFEDPARQQALKGGDAAALEAQLKARPEDQELVVALASVQSAGGDRTGAVARLEALGRPGWTSGGAQLLLAALLADGERSAHAELILTRHVAARLPAFQKAAQAYSEAIKQAEDRHVARARQGELPADLKAELDAPGKSDELKREAFRKWLFEQLAQDETVKARRTEYARHDVVPAVLLLGRVKLQRANASAGETRQRLLAEAERVFLAVQKQAEGELAYHLVLGQVYYRLGKTDEGAGQFAVLLGKNEPGQTLAVANAYYELGIHDRGRLLTEAVHGSAPEPLRTQAARLRALMALSREDTETWLRKGNPEDPHISLALRELQADTLFDQGRYTDADTLYAGIAAEKERASNEAAAANNAALVYRMRASATGDPRHLARAAELLASALRAAPDSAVISANLSELLHHQGILRVLERFLPTGDLHLDSSEARVLLRALLGGPRRTQVRALLRQELGRAVELARTYETLAPQSPGAYRRQVELYDDLDDPSALQGLLERMRKVQLETASAAEQRQRWVSGVEDAKLRERHDARVKRTRTIVDALGAAPARADERQRALRAAATLLLAAHLDDRFEYFGDPADAEAAVALVARATAHWDGLSFRTDWILFGQALLRAGETSAGLGQLWKDRRRHAGWELLRRLLQHPELEALRRRPELPLAAAAARQALTPRAGVEGRRPSAYDWLLARVTADPALEALARPALDRPQVKTEIEVEALLAPDSRDHAAMLELVGKRGR